MIQGNRRRCREIRCLTTSEFAADTFKKRALEKYLLALWKGKIRFGFFSHQLVRQTGE